MQKCMSCMFDYGTQRFCPYCGADNSIEADDIGQIPAGTILNRRFIIGDIISRDRIGFTYIAWDALLERKVAVKEWFPQGLAEREENHLDVSYYMDEELSRSLTEQFLDHARQLHKMQNLPCLVPIYMVFEENNTAYYFMEYISGRTLRDIVRETNPLDPADAEGIMAKVFQALDILHGNGLVHGNLTPENIFLDDGGGIRFVNLAWFSAEMEKIRYGLFRGKYAPFAYYRKPVVQKISLDTYGANAVYYRLLTGEEPVGVVDRLKKKKLPAIQEYGIDVPSRTARQIMDGMREEPAGKRAGRKRGGFGFFQLLAIPLTAVAAVLGVLILIT